MSAAAEKPIDDSFRSWPAPRPDKRTRVACCPTDREPLVMTLERDGAEFHCVHCGGWFGFLAPIAAVETPELLARCDENEAIYNERKAAR